MWMVCSSGVGRKREVLWREGRKVRMGSVGKSVGLFGPILESDSVVQHNSTSDSTRGHALPFGLEVSPTNVVYEQDYVRIAESRHDVSAVGAGADRVGTGAAVASAGDTTHKEKFCEFWAPCYSAPTSFPYIATPGTNHGHVPPPMFVTINTTPPDHLRSCWWGWGWRWWNGI